MRLCLCKECSDELRQLAFELVQKGPSEQTTFEFFSLEGRNASDIAKVGTFGNTEPPPDEL